MSMLINKEVRQILFSRSMSKSDGTGEEGGELMDDDDDDEDDEEH